MISKLLFLISNVSIIIISILVIVYLNSIKLYAKDLDTNNLDQVDTFNKNVNENDTLENNRKNKDIYIDIGFSCGAVETYLQTNFYEDLPDVDYTTISTYDVFIFGIQTRVGGKIFRGCCGISYYIYTAVFNNHLEFLGKQKVKFGLKFLRIPLTLQISPIKFKFFKPFLDLGLQNNILIKADMVTQSDYFSFSGKKEEDVTNQFKRFYITPEVGFGVELVFKWFNMFILFENSFLYNSIIDNDLDESSSLHDLTPYNVEPSFEIRGKIISIGFNYIFHTQNNKNE